MPEKDLSEKARQISIQVRTVTYSNVFNWSKHLIYFYLPQNLQPFFNSEMFKSNNFKYDAGRKLIVQQY